MARLGMKIGWVTFLVCAFVMASSLAGATGLQKQVILSRSIILGMVTPSIPLSPCVVGTKSEIPAYTPLTKASTKIPFALSKTCLTSIFRDSLCNDLRSVLVTEDGNFKQKHAPHGYLCTFSLNKMLGRNDRATAHHHGYLDAKWKKRKRNRQYSPYVLASTQPGNGYEGKAILGVLNRWVPLIPKTKDQSERSGELVDFVSVVSSFQEPMRSAVVTRSLGRTKKGGFHAGTDFAAPVGTPVFPIAKGRVIFAGWLPVFRQYGSIVIVNHGAGVYALYGHVKPVRALKPRKEHKGRLNYTPVDVDHDTVIARIASPNDGESSTGPHLHLEMIVVDRESAKPRYTLHNVLKYLPKSRKFKYFALSEEMGQQDPFWVTCALSKRTTLPAPPLHGLRSILERFGFPTEPGLASMVSNLF